METTNWLCSDRGGAPVGRLLAAVGEPADSLTVITFNHDLVIESEIFRRARLRSRWCLANGYGNLGDELHTTDPEFPGEQLFPPHGDDCNHSQPVTVLKLHGSLNWVVRLNSTQPTPNALLGVDGRRNIYLMQTRKIQPRVVIRRVAGPGGPGRQTWNAWPVIIPPIYSKQALRARIQRFGQTLAERLNRVIGWSSSATRFRQSISRQRSFSSEGSPSTTLSSGPTSSIRTLRRLSATPDSPRRFQFVGTRQSISS